jgi:di/tricarboxylate transporter
MKLICLFLFLFASLFIVSDAFAHTGLAETGLQALVSRGFLPDRLSLLAPLAVFSATQSEMFRRW